MTPHIPRDHEGASAAGFPRPADGAEYAECDGAQVPIVEWAVRPRASKVRHDGGAAGADSRPADGPAQGEESESLGEPADEIAQGFSAPAVRHRPTGRSAAERADREDEDRGDGTESLRRLARRITVAACAGFTLLVVGAGAITEHQLGSYDQHPTAPHGVEPGDDADGPGDRDGTRPRPGLERGLSGAGVSPMSRATRHAGPADDLRRHGSREADHSARARRPLRPGQAGRTPTPAGPRSSPEQGPPVRPRTQHPHGRPGGAPGHAHARGGHEHGHAHERGREHERGRAHGQEQAQERGEVSPPVRTAPQRGSRRSA